MSRECVRFSTANNNSTSSQPNTTSANSNDASLSQETNPQQTTSITLNTESCTPSKKPPVTANSQKKSATPAKPKSPIAIDNAVQIKQETSFTINCSGNPTEQQQPQPIVNILPQVKAEPHNSTDEIIDSAVRQLAICDRILSIAQSHQTTCSYTKLKREQLLESTNRSQKQLQLSVTCSDESAAEDIQRLEMWRCLCALIGPDILRIVEFAKRIPDFKSVQQSEQIILLKARFFPVWLVRIACMLTASSLTFDSGYCITHEQLELVYSADFVARLIEFARFVAALKLNDIEVGLIAAITITSTKEIENLLDAGTRQQVDRTNKELVEALQFEIRNRLRSDKVNSDQESVALFCNQIAEVVEQLHILAHMHNQEINFYRQHVNKVKLPHILSEIYEIENGPSQSVGVRMMQEAGVQQPLTNISNTNGNVQYAGHQQSEVQFSHGPEALLNMQQQQDQQGQYQVIHLNQNEFNGVNHNRLAHVNAGNLSYQFKQEHGQHDHHIQSHENMLLVQQMSNQIN